MAYLTTEEARAKYPGAVIGLGTSIGQGTSIGHGVSIGKGVHIGHGVRLGKGVAIGPGVFIGQGVIIGPGVVLGLEVVIESGVVLESGVRLESGVCIESGARIGPNSVITNTIGTHHHWNIYDDLRSGIPRKILRYGCVTLPITSWKEQLDTLLERHGGDECRSELESILNGK